MSRFLLAFRNKPNEEGAVVIQNLPIDTLLPDTPINTPYAKKYTFYSEWSLMLLISVIADIIAYKEEMKGKYIHDIVPRPGNESEQSNGVSVLLEFHTEHGFHPFKQDYIGLYCLRRDHEAKAMTMGASVINALQHLDQTTVHILQEKRFRIHLPFSFMSKRGEAYFSPNMSVLSTDLKMPSMCVDFDAMRAIDPEAKIALKLFEQALQAEMMGNVLAPGEMLIIDNQLIAHARTAFSPKYDGKDRWLQRISAVRDIRRVKNSFLDDTRICRPVLEETMWKQIYQRKPLCPAA